MTDVVSLAPFRALDANGNPVGAAEAYFYRQGTTTPLTVYSDAAGSSAHPSPLVADANGVFAAVFNTSAFNVKVDVKDPDTDASLPGYPIDYALLGKTDTGAASSISFNPTADIPESNVQDAIERVQAGFGDLGTMADLDEGTSAHYRANTADKGLVTDQVWGAMAEVTLADEASIALDLSTGFDFTVTLTANRTLANPTNAKVGQRGRIRVVQDATGSRTLSFGTSYEFRGGVTAVLTTAANAEDVLYYDVISSTRILISSVLDIS